VARKKQKSKASPDNNAYRLLVCGGTGCISAGSLQVAEALEAELRKTGLKKKAHIVLTGCIGSCNLGPVMLVEPDEVFYVHLEPGDAKEIVARHIGKGEVVERLLYKDSEQKRPVAALSGIRFFSKQTKRVLRNCGVIDPANIDEYIGAGGYSAVGKALKEMARDDVVKEVLDSGLRGRGGAGFPTGRKWQFCKGAKGGVKYVICNGDEGDPGAFMDRSVLEGDPHAVVEGMLISGYAIGANQGYAYIRAEYPLAIERFEGAIEQARGRGYLGDKILGTDFSFDIEIRIGAGAFVCGEETALMMSIEGKRGMPRPRPPFPAYEGLWKKPTCLNNVETLASVPMIINNGAAWYRELGTEKSPGTKVFALAGNVNNTGLVEVPMGITLREIVEDIGGGIPNRRKFKAAQIGGPSGGCIPAEHIDTPVDYESVKELGAIMGSGGLIIIDDKACMVNLAKFFLEFVQDESCGKCPPCRIGTKLMLDTLTRITKGEGKPGDIDELEKLAQHIKEGSLCGLGQTAPNPVLTTIRYFRDEYEEHINNKRCPAAVCVDLLLFDVSEERCKKCGRCYEVCPVDAIRWKKKETAVIDKAKCIKCRSCIEVCPFDAIN